MTASKLYSGMAVAVLVLHALFLLWVVFGALIARSRPVLRWLHILSLVWGILTELTPWPCPLTILENWLEARAGVERTRAISCFTIWIGSFIQTFRHLFLLSPA